MTVAARVAGSTTPVSGADLPLDPAPVSGGQFYVIAGPHAGAHRPAADLPRFAGVSDRRRGTAPSRPTTKVPRVPVAEVMRPVIGLTTATERPSDATCAAPAAAAARRASACATARLACAVS